MKATTAFTAILQKTTHKLKLLTHSMMNMNLKLNIRQYSKSQWTSYETRWDYLMKKTNLKNSRDTVPLIRQKEFDFIANSWRRGIQHRRLFRIVGCKAK